MLSVYGSERRLLLIKLLKVVQSAGYTIMAAIVIAYSLGAL